eukprot:6192225-Pleurochrysis_carterae.AAC.1
MPVRRCKKKLERTIVNPFPLPRLTPLQTQIAQKWPTGRFYAKRGEAVQVRQNKYTSFGSMALVLE